MLSGPITVLSSCYRVLLVLLLRCYWVVIEVLLSCYRVVIGFVIEVLLTVIIMLSCVIELLLILQPSCYWLCYRNAIVCYWVSLELLLSCYWICYQHVIMCYWVCFFSCMWQIGFPNLVQSDSLTSCFQSAGTCFVFPGTAMHFASLATMMCGKWEDCSFLPHGTLMRTVWWLFISKKTVSRSSCYSMLSSCYCWLLSKSLHSTPGETRPTKIARLPDRKKPTCVIRNFGWSYLSYFSAFFK